MLEVTDLWVSVAGKEVLRVLVQKKSFPRNS